MDLKQSIHILTSADVSDDALTSWLGQVNENISFLDRKNENIVNFILMLNWTERGESVCCSYSEVVLNLVTAYDVYLRSIFKMIIRHFIPASEDPTHETNPFVHKLLQNVCKLIPSAESVLLPMLAESFPYMRKNVIHQIFFVRNLLNLTSYMPNSRPAVLELIIIKLLQIDVHCPRETILEWEENEKPADNESIFVMESDAPKEDEIQHPLGNVLDVLLHEVFKYIQSSCFVRTSSGVPSSDLNWEATKKTYKELLTIFDAIILPTHACAHVQFVMFYICSFKILLCEGFVDYLWKKVQNPNVSSVIRQASTCYMGSLLSRGKYVPIRMVQDCLKLMCSWINYYIDNQSESYTYVDAAHHSTFYSVCQVVFYLVTFRHKEMVHDRKGRHVLKELNLERIVNCRLNPLKNCLPVIVKNFSTVARNYQIAYCNTIIERNNRLFVPLNSDHSSVELSSFLALETFFPFDPYLLKRSGKIIQPLYREYEGHIEQAHMENEENETVGSPVFGSSQSPPFMTDLHATSPGYRQHEFSPKFR